MSPFGVRLGRPERLAVLGHVQDVGVQFGSHDEDGARTLRVRVDVRVWQVKEEEEGGGGGGVVCIKEENLARRELGRDDDGWDSRLRQTPPQLAPLLPISLSGVVQLWKRRRDELLIRRWRKFRSIQT